MSRQDLDDIEVVDPGDIRLPILDDTQRDALTNLQKTKVRILNEFDKHELELDKITIKM